MLLMMAGLVIASCATRTVQIKGDPQITSSQEDYRSFFLLGNMGVNQTDSQQNIAAIVDDIASKERDGDYTIILGDNVEAQNINEDDEDNDDLKQFTDQLDIVAQLKSNKLVIPGDHDWNDDGIKGLKKIEELTEDLLDNDEVFQPENACPIEEIDVSDEIELIVVDSQWYIENWNDNPRFNDECEIKTREKFITILADAVRKARHKTVILAMHHPLYANGVHGGELGTRMITKPVQENAYIPVVGFAYSFMRSQAAFFPQDRYNPLMNELMEQIEIMGAGLDRMIVVSAHEESLQLIDKGSIKQIISGATVSRNIASLGKKGRYSAGQIGYAELRVYKDHSSKVYFHTVDEDDLKESYASDLFENKIPYDVSLLPRVEMDSMTATVYPMEETQVDQEHINLYGRHYRHLYGIEVVAPVVMLDTLYGGLRVERAGGGNQTQGLRLVDKDDREFNMRALEKDAIQFLKSTGYNKLDAEQYFGDTFPEELIRDFYTAAHPYGAFAVPRLAGAIDLNHTHPKLFWVPKQPVLGDFNELHGDRLYMIVEKPDDSFNNAHMFGYNEDVESTDDLFDKLREDEEFIVDEKLYIRARIFDMLLGDWDRHEDQWRWAQIEEDGSDIKRFVAIPRDRDQVFARFDGNLLEFLRKFMGAPRQFGNYGPDIEHIKEFSQSAMELDRALLQRTTRQDWLEQVSFIQQRIDASIVNKAFNEMPDAVKDEQWKQTQQDLLDRKANLTNIVNRYYDEYSQFQTLKGTDKDDVFNIISSGDEVSISGYRIKDGVAEDLLFERSFKSSETKEIWIYGLDDDDEFNFTTTGKSDIKITVAGGKGNDVYTGKIGSMVKIFDYASEENEYKDIPGNKIVLRDDYDINHYDHEKKPSTNASIDLQLNYNPDDGFNPIFKYTKTKIGYERNPFTTQYGLGVDYRSLTQAAVFDFFAARANFVGHWNLYIDASITTNNYTENFFGYGNDSQFDNSLDFDDNRILMQQQSAGISIGKSGDYGSHFNVGFEYLGVEADASTPASTGIENQRDDYLTYHFDYQFESYDNKRFKTRGTVLKADLGYTDNLANGENFASIDPSIKFWNALDSERRLVIQTSINGQLRIGDDPLFYQAARLGADRGLRGYRQDRYAGNYALSGSIDLRYDMVPIKTALLPLRLVPYLGVDTGRVWTTSDDLADFRTSYGGGLELALTGLVNARISYFNTDEGGRLSFGVFLSQ
jgi:hypothetical protein